MADDQIPALPQGYTLDQGTPPLPTGYSLDASTESPEEFRARVRKALPDVSEQMINSVVKNPQLYKNQLPKDFEAAPQPEKKGFWQAFKSDFSLPGAQNPYPGMGVEAKVAAANEAAAADTARKERGSGLVYRGAAAAVSPLANVQGMEEAAEKADTGGVLGHMVAGQTMAAAPLIAEGGVKVAGKVGETIAPARNYLAEKAVAPLVRKAPLATAEDIKFNRDPANAIVDEGLVAGSKKGLVGKINDRVGQLSDSLDKQLQNHPNANTKIDAGPIIDKGIDNAIQAAKKAGNKSVQGRLEDLREALKTEHGPINGTPFEINELKRSIGETGSDIGAFKSTDPVEASAASAIQDVYRGLKEAVNKEIPEAAPINERIANLLSARTGVNRNIALSANKSPFSVIGAGHAAAKALEATAGSTPVRTAAAQLLKSGETLGLPKIITAAPAASGVRGGSAPNPGLPPRAVVEGIKGTPFQYKGRSASMGVSEIFDPQTGISVSILDRDLDPIKIKAKIAAKLKDFSQ